jgi:hypothetical protein
MNQYYADESTENPIWLFQTRRGQGLWETLTGQGLWETLTVFPSREEAENFGRSQYGKYPAYWRAYAVPIYNDRLAKAMSELRPDLVREPSPVTTSLALE